MFDKRYTPVGSRPGTMNLGEKVIALEIHVFLYSGDECEELNLDMREVEEGPLVELKKRAKVEKKVLWLDVQGLGSEKVLRVIAAVFDLHPLTLGDIANVPQRPKVSTHEDYALYIGSMVSMEENNRIEFEQLSIIWANSFLLTFQEKPGDMFDPVRERLRSKKGSIRKSSSDYLGYALIDSSIDALYPVIENLGDQLEELEDRIVFNPSENSLQEVYEIKRELLKLRKIAWAQREAASVLIRDDNPFVRKSTKVFFRDTYQHCAHILDVLETYREIAASFMEVYLSSVSNKMNEVMTLLTIIGTIFIPLSFLTGVFGMNFEFMPELKWKWSYPVFWVLILSITFSLIRYFRKKNWL